MPSSGVSHYSIDQSPLYKMRNHRKLAGILFVSQIALKRLSNSADRYRCWSEPKKNGGSRPIEAPPEDLKAVQRRISDLLQRITPPDFLMAPVKGRSYVHNAALHVGSRSFRLLDIEDFFPSCTDKRLYWFFQTKMQCSPDIASTLTRICSLNGRLPQGSPCSPILAYFAYCDMWERISEIVYAAGCKLSIYADDITISGQVIYERDVWEIKKVLFRAGHRYNREKERSIVDKPADITGVIVSGTELLLPNRQHLRLSEAQKARKVANKRERPSLDRQIRGRVAQARQITNHLERYPIEEPARPDQL
jgi:hypothetical protein